MKSYLLAVLVLMTGCVSKREYQRTLQSIDVHFADQQDLNREFFRVMKDHEDSILSMLKDAKERQERSNIYSEPAKRAAERTDEKLKSQMDGLRIP